jgi:hypothetical protein
MCVASIRRSERRLAKPEVVNSRLQINLSRFVSRGLQA